MKIDVKTLYNWKKNKPELYRIVMLGFKFDELLWLSKQNFEEMQKLARENQNYRLR